MQDDIFPIYYGKIDILTITELNIGEICDLGGTFVLSEFKVHGLDTAVLISESHKKLKFGYCKFN